MRKFVFKQFFDCLHGQKKWLNQQSKAGYHLTETSRVGYYFNECEPGKYDYDVIFIGNMTKRERDTLISDLEKKEFRLFRKGLQMNLSIGKVKWRPWSKNVVATSPGIYNRELLIVERERTGAPFEVNLNETVAQYKAIKNMYLYTFFLFLSFSIFMVVLGFLMSEQGNTIPNTAVGGLVFLCLSLFPLNIFRKYRNYMAQMNHLGRPLE